MPITRKKLTTEEATVEVQFEGETCNVVYNRRAITPKFLRDADKLEKAEGASGSMQALIQLEHLVIEWDVLDEKGRKLPCNREVMDTLPLDFLGAVLTAVWDNYSPNLTRSVENSASPSSPKAPEAASQTGISSFG